MAKQLNVNLAFTANTSEAKRQLQDLQHQLNQLANTPVSLKGKGITKEIIEASNAAAELKVHLDKATNVQTGNLDFTKLSQSIKNSGSSLAEYGEKLKSLGPAGNTAFQALAQSVAKAEIPIRRSNAALTEMWTTLKNTARWQVSSSILHGFMGAVQSAYGYAQDLNSSLNNIRIVTGQNTEQMARFAEEANKAARALSATTTDYTNASLIYYQQGLSDSEVAQRTEVTIKMANVAGVSAEKVSDQLTAVWNNFYDGSKSLEYYADVMTALGAATASSTDEISDGLNKFAAVAETVGLSYEYATSALATVTATTRESADVVGTAFKTLFARIQGLTLGETLEDGTDLNKYSEALYKVGIDIKDTNGNMKDMDAILNELGAKWQTLGKDQQTALAQTVAGVRQYTQLVALMDNWDYFQENLGVATGATGALQEQADIYVESWEAAQKRVTAAAEAIYSDLLNDDFFIDVLNGFEKFLGLIDHLLDSMGGVQGALAGISALVLKLFSNQISQGITNMAYNMKMMTESGRQAVQDEQKAFIADAADSLNPSMDSTIEGQTKAESLKQQLNLQVSMIENIDKMSEAEKEVNSMLMDRLRLLSEESALKAKAVDAAQEKVASASLDARADAVYSAQFEAGYENREEASKKANADYNAASATLKTEIGQEEALLRVLEKIRKESNVSQDALDELNKTIDDLDKTSKGALKHLLGDLPQVGEDAEEAEVKLREVADAARIVIQETGEKGMLDIGVTNDNLQKVTQGYREEARAIQEKNEVVSSEQQLIEDLNNRIINAQGNQKRWSDTLVTSAQGVSSMVMGLSSLKSAVDAVSNPNLSGWERLSALATSLAMGLPMLASGFKTISTEMNGMNTSMTSAIGIKTAMIGLYGAENTALITTIALDKTATEAEKLKQLQDKLGMTQEQAKQALQQGTIIGKAKGIAMTIAETGATWAQNMADKAHTGTIWGIVAAWIAEQAAAWPVLVVTLAIVAALGLIVAIAALVVAGVNAISNAYNADAIAAENAEKGAKNLADAYNGVKQEYEDMIASMENYKSARDALDNLTEGTKEYDAALKEANRAAMELVNQYGLIEGQDYEWQGDELVVKDEAMDRVSAAKEAEADEAYAASQMANANAKALRAQANLTDARREIRDDNGLGDGDLIWQSIGAGLVNTIVPGVGNLIMANQMSESAEMDAAIQRAVEEAKDNQNLFDTKEAMAEALNIDLNDTDLVDALWANQEEIQSLANEMNAAEAAWKMAAQNSANEILNNNEAVQNSENAEDVMAAGGNMYSVAYEDAYDKYLADAKDRGLYASKKAFEDYAEKAGLNDLKNFEVTNYKGDGTVEYKYIDDQGQEQKVIATTEEIAATLAAAEAAEKLGASAENLVRVFNDLDASGKAYDQAMKDFLSAGDFENATKEEATALTSLVDTGGDGTVNATEASTYLGTEFGGEDKVLSDEEAKQYGYESAQAMIDAFTEELNNIDEAWESIELPSELKGLDNMSLKTAQAFENTIKDLNLGPAGEEAGAQYVEGINKMVEGLSEEDQTKALEQLATIDWSDWDALEQADAIMKEFGVDIDTTSDEWVQYAKDMRLASGATPDFSKLRDTLTSITGILQDLDFGSVISDEDYQKLVEYNDEWERFFMLQADGSRVFIGDAQAMQRETRADIMAQREALDARKAAQEGFEKANWGHKDENGSWVKADWGNKSGSDTGTATNLMNASGATEDMLEQLGYTDEVIQDMITKATSGQADLVAEGEAQLREMYQRIDGLTEEELAEMDAQFDEMMASTATSVDDLQNLLESGQTSETAYDKQLSVLANNAGSLEELQRIRDTGTITGEDGTKIGLDTQEYGQALLNLADNYSNCTEEAEEYSKALASGNEATIKAAREALEASVEIGELAEKYDLNSEQLEDYAKRLKDLHKDSNLSAKDAAKLATANMRLDRGMSNLNDNLEDYKKALDESNVGSAEWSNTLSDLKTDLADMLNVADGSMLSDQFAQDILASEDLKLALDGDADAILRLRLAAADDIIANLDVDDTALANVQTQWQYLKDNMAAGVAAGDVDQTRLIASFNEMIRQGNMTKEQIEAALSGLHVSANVKTTYVSQKQQVPLTVTETSWLPSGTMTVPVPDGNGGTKNETYTSMRRVTRTYDAGTSEADVVVPQYEIEGTEGPGNITTAFNALPAPSASKSSTTSGKQSGGGGGGGSTPSVPDKSEKRDTTKKSDVAERYREVSDSIDNVTDALTRAERATDRLWGKEKLDAMRQENKILAEQYKLLQQKAQEAEDYAKQDYNDLMDVADEIGVSVVVDTNTGDITNIEDVEKTLYDRLAAAEAEYNRKVEAYNAAVDAAGDSPTEEKVKELETMKDALDAYEKDIIGGIEDDISAWEDAEQQFQDSVETWEDAGLEAEAILDEMMQKNFDIWSESLQLEVEVNDRDLELLDYYLSKTEDNVYKMAEAAALMVGNLNSGFEGGQLGEYIDNLSIYGEKYAELTDRLNSTDPEYQITSAQYKEGLEEIQSGLLDNLSSIQELDDAMLNYYGDTLSMVGEEIDKYTEKMEHQTSILEHYANMMDILGKSQDYEAMGTILEGQVETIKNELDVAEAEYNLYAEEAEKKRKLYEEAVAKGDAAAAELYKGEWEAAEEAAMEAQSNMLDKTEQWAEAMKAVVENKLQGLAKSLEEALTGGTSFDQINTQLERAASLQEEYLTTTNQIYETNKLMRTAQQAMDKSTNSVAKQRLKDFIKETDQLQDKSKLSKYELEIQQAKYDLLLAEMALEDAQNAKTTVRLQRDSEGNMGYVYTADQSQLSQAQQQLEDAQNSLYNIGLEGANSYTEKYNQTMQEMYDTLTSISEAYYNGEIASQEEYEAQMLAAQEYYYEQLENFQDLYGVALQTDTRVIKDAWSTGMGAMKVETRTWKDAVKEYTGEATATLAGWYNKVDEIAAKTGLDNIANKVNNVTTESQNLKDTILGVDGDKGVIGALKDELTAVGDLTGGYANLRTTIQGLITDYENLMKTVNNAQNQQQSEQDKNESGDGGNSGDTGTGNNPDGTTPGSGDAGDTTPNTTPGNETPTIAKGQSVTVKTSATHFSRDGGNGTRMRSFVPGSTYTVMNFDDDEVMIGRNGVVTGWVKKTDLVGFDTGGYTGSWGSYGKMAMLHEKELVLNEGDTSNFLASMEVLERILEVIDLQSMNAQLGGLLNTPSFGNNGTSQTVEQNVHIEASFPGVSDRNEIEEAFNNLINTASQYANRKF